jgi:hypothetical protein
MRWLSLLLTLVLASPVLAADGDTFGTSSSRGKFLMVGRYICDSDVDNTTCGEIDLTGSGLGLPSHYVISLETTAGCSAGTIMPLGLHASGGTTYDLVTSAWNLSSGAGTGQDFARPTHRYLSAVIASEVGCTDIDLVVFAFYEKF